jgi:hypothetical protein
MEGTNDKSIHFGVTFLIRESEDPGFCLPEGNFSGPKERSLLILPTNVTDVTFAARVYVGNLPVLLFPFSHFDA